MPTPNAVLIGGANGSGKTTFARQFIPLLHPRVPFLNADEIQREREQFAFPAAAARELLRRLHDAETSVQSFAVETTLSSRSYIPRVRRWRELGFHTTLHFIEVPSAEFAVERVRARVAAGGHDIPEADIRRRFARGKRLFFELYTDWFDASYHWYSDSNGLRLLAKGTRASE
jgi:predicted ABC-type ATPase